MDPRGTLLTAWATPIAIAIATEETDFLTLNLAFQRVSEDKPKRNDTKSVML